MSDIGWFGVITIVSVPVSFLLGMLIAALVYRWRNG